MSKLKLYRSIDCDLRVELEAKHRERREIGEAALSENRAMTDQERAKFLALGKDIDRLDRKVAINAVPLEKAEEANEAERNWRGGPLIDPDEAAAAAGMAAAGIQGIDRLTPRVARSPGEPLTFQAIHGPTAPSLQGWRSQAEIFQVLGAGLNDPRLVAGQGGNSDSLGGYALPTATEIAVFDGSVPKSIFLSRANVQPMTTRRQEVVTFDRSGDGAAGTYFGMAFEFIPEGGAGANVQTASLRLIGMDAKTASILFDCSNEQLQDAPGFEGKMMAAVQAAVGYGIDRVCLRGTGAGQPLGVLNQPSLITVDKQNGQQADTIVYENLTAMFSRLPGASVGSSVWLASQSCIPALSTLSVAVGTGGSHIPVMTESNGQFSILTRPVIFTDLCRPIGDAADLVICDLSQYTIGMRAGMAIERSMHVGFAKNRITFRLLMRFDGGSGWDQPFQPEFSAPTQSPFIQLAARA
jgi:HK97 family phage major capsid protein